MTLRFMSEAQRSTHRRYVSCKPNQIQFLKTIYFILFNFSFSSFYSIIYFTLFNQILKVMISFYSIIHFILLNQFLKQFHLIPFNLQFNSIQSSFQIRLNRTKSRGVRSNRIQSDQIATNTSDPNHPRVQNPAVKNSWSNSGVAKC